MESILQRIKNWRNKRGYSYETMAHELNISPAAYRKIEMNQTKLTVERLFQIVKVLDIELEDILNIRNTKILTEQLLESGTTNNNFEYFLSATKEKIAKIEMLYEERVKEQAITINQLITIISNKVVK